MELHEETLCTAALRRTDDQCRTGIVLNTLDTSIVVFLNHSHQVARQALPLFLQRQHARATGLKMGMIGSRCATARTIIEDCEVWESLQQPVDFIIKASAT